MESIAYIKNRLLQFGVKPSLQRIAIMDYLLTHPTHPTADTIFNALYPAVPTLSKTTVYNTLKLLAEQGAVLSLTIDEKNIRYDGDISHHAHFRCRSCGNVFDLPMDEMPGIPPGKLNGFDITECHVYYKGYCKSCREEANKTEN